MNKKLLIPLYAVCFSVILAPTASAYIDPATTSYIIQIGAGIVIALGTVLGIYWKKIKGAFKKKKENIEELPEVQQNSLNANEADVITADDLLDDDDQ